MFVDRRNFFDMGRIDGDKMYDIVMSWDWGNSGNLDIYYDIEICRNGIIYCSNLVCLVDVLIREGKREKVEDILDLVMEKMFIKFFEYYFLLEFYILSYYEFEKIEKVCKVFEEILVKY